MWNPCGICGIHVEYVESMWNTMESIWNMWNLCGIHMEYYGVHMDSIPFHLDSRGIFHGIFKFHGVSIWNEHGNLGQNDWALSQTNSIWNPWNPHGIGIHSTWNPPGMWGHSKDLTLNAGLALFATGGMIFTGAPTLR